MKILLLTNLFYDNPTAATILEGLGRAYAARGHEVIAAGQYHRKADGKPARESAPWGRVERLGGQGPDLERRRARTAARLRRLAAWSDLIHLQWAAGWDLAGAFQSALASSGRPVLATVQDYDHPQDGPPSPARASSLRRLLSSCRWLTANSEFTRRAIARHHPGLSRRATVLGNGQDVGAPPPVARAPRGRPYVLYVGRLLPYKGVDLLLLAWKDLCARHPGVDLVLCGPEPRGPFYRQLARDLGLGSRVRFTGPVPRRRAWDLMRGSLFCALPSRAESFGMAALEAMACGKAVLATRSGPAEYIRHGRSGWLVAPGDERALARGLERLLRDGSLRNRLGRGARRAAAGRTWQAVADDCLEISAENW